MRGFLGRSEFKNMFRGSKYFFCLKFGFVLTSSESGIGLVFPAIMVFSGIGIWESRLFSGFIWFSG